MITNRLRDAYRYVDWPVLGGWLLVAWIALTWLYVMIHIGMAAAKV